MSEPGAASFHSRASPDCWENCEEVTPLLQSWQMSAMASQSEETPKEEQDVICRTIGDFGRWQLTLTFLLSLFNLPCTWHIYALTFQSPSQVDFWCTPPDNLVSMPVHLWRNISHTAAVNNKLLDNPCQIYDVDYTKFTPETILSHDFAHEGVGQRDCDAWSYREDTPEETLVSKWDLVCNRANLANTAQTVFLAGVAFGGLISGFLSDRFGRKKTLMASTVLQLTLGVIMAFVPWLQLYLVLKFFLGLISVSIVFTGFVLCMELVGGKWRTISGVCYIFPVSVGYISSAGISYFVREWRYNQLAISLPGLLLVSLYWILPESPRWLLTMGRVDETMKILKEASNVNHRPLPANLDKLIQQSLSQNPNDEPEKVGVLDLFRYPNIRKKSLVLFVIWFSVYFVYYGLVMNMTSLGGDIFLNTIISGFVEIPSIGLSIIILLKLGRRWPMGLTTAISGVVCLISTSFSTTQENLTFALAMAARSLVACSNVIMPVYTAELFPTVVRNLGVGACNVAGGTAMVIGPFLWNLAVYAEGLPMALLGLCGIIGGLVALTLPETANQPMINTLEEGEKWGSQLKTAKQPDTPMTGNFNKTYSE